MKTTSAGWFSALLLVLPGTGQAQDAAGAAPATCSRAAPAESASFDSTRLDVLAGSFNVVLIDTTVGRGGRTLRGSLALRVPDSASPAARWPLVGSYVSAPPDTGEAWRRMEAHDAAAPGVVWRNGSLRLGEMGDPGGINLFITSLAPGEFRGTWSRNSGLGVVIDYTGNRRIDAGGFFCAVRTG